MCTQIIHPNCIELLDYLQEKREESVRVLAKKNGEELDIERKVNLDTEQCAQAKNKQ